MVVGWVVVVAVVVVLLLLWAVVVVDVVIDDCWWVVDVVAESEAGADGEGTWVAGGDVGTTAGFTRITAGGVGAGGCLCSIAAAPPVETTSAATPVALLPAGRRRGISPSGAPASGASQAVKPTVRQRRLIEMLRKARTRVGSRWVPEELTSSRRAAATPMGRLYGRAAVMVSKASTTATMRAPSEISRPRSPLG